MDPVKRFITLFLLFTGNLFMFYGKNQQAEAADAVRTETYSVRSGRTVYAYLPKIMEPGMKYPMVLALNCTTGNPQAEVKTNGWDKIVQEENIIVIAPEYNNYATYSETSYIKSVVDDAVKRYPVDTERIYSTGFSNGGALSVALVSTYPEIFAGISAMGWMIGMHDISSDAMIPFLLIQGTREYTQQSFSGAMEIMNDEKTALRDLFTYNHMKEANAVPDYDRVPYWGYMPDRSESVFPEYYDYDPYGNSPVIRSNVEWQINQYFAEGYENPFAELILVDGSGHIPHDCNAKFAWEFFRHFRRVEGKIIEE